MNAVSPLQRLVHAPVMTPAQARHLFERLGGSRVEHLEYVLSVLADPDTGRSHDAQYLLDNVLDARDREWVTSVVSSDRPLRLRAHLRTLFQDALLHGRIKDEEAEIPVPAGEVLAFHVEDVARELGSVPSPWQRARVAAESLVGDVPLPDDAAPAAVASLSARLNVDPAQVWAELLVHPLARVSYREAAARALERPVSSSVPMFHLAVPALLPGAHRETAERSARHHGAEHAVHIRSAVSAMDGAGAFVAWWHVDGAEPAAWAASVAADGSRVMARTARGLEAEHVDQWAWRLAQPMGGLVEMAPPHVVALVQRALENARSPDAEKARTTFTALSNGTAPQPPPVPPVGTVDVAALDNPLCKAVELGNADIPERWKKDLSKELRARGRPRDETVASCVQDIAGRKGVVPRVQAALTHDATVLHAMNDAAASSVMSLADALSRPASATPVLRALLLRSLGVRGGEQGPEPGFRDDLRDLVIPVSKPPTGLHVLALDLAAAAWEQSLAQQKCLEGMEEDEARELCAAAGSRAARAMFEVTPGTTEESRLQEAARAAIKDVASDLPSRQRRDLVDAWMKGWTELIVRACRGTCSQRCLEAPGQPRLDAAYSLDHPRLNKAWP